MKKADVAKLHNGVYRVFWKSGGYSVAAVGRLCDGRVWLAPANWISGYSIITWPKVLRVELLESEAQARENSLKNLQSGS